MSPFQRAVFKMGQNNQLEFYLKTEEAWKAMLDACASARQSIDLEQYIFINDRIGRKFIEVLMKKARQGVKIRLLCDMAGSYAFYNGTAPALLQKNGIKVRFFNIIQPWRLKNFTSWFFRDHRKILIIDKKVGFTGGVGIREDMLHWRDTLVRIESRIVDEMIYTFDIIWGQAGDKSFSERIKRAKQQIRGFNFITNTPYPRRRYLYHAFIDALQSAQKYIYLTTPYFTPNHRLMRILRKSAKLGVDVQLLIPKTSDVMFVGRAMHTFYTELLQAGISIYEYNGEFMHTKSAVLDDKWATTGSFNLNQKSFFYDYEANIVSMDRLFVLKLKEHYLNDLKRAEKVDIEQWKKRPFFSKFREALILPFRRFM